MENNYTKTCPRCGRIIDLYTLVCPHCGEMFAVHYTDDRGLYIKENTSYYFRRFNEMNSKGTQNSWNWGAFFFCEVWMAYRKMYKEAILFGVIILGILAAVLIFGLPSGISSLLSFVVSLFAGLRGNYMYMMHVDKLVNQGTAMPPYQKEPFANKVGGTNFLYGIIMALAMGAMNTVITSIFM